MTHHHPVPLIELPPGTVHRVVVDLVRVGLWSEQQAAVTRSDARRRQLGITTLACRLAAEVVRETLCVPFPIVPTGSSDGPTDPTPHRDRVRTLHQHHP